MRQVDRSPWDLMLKWRSLTRALFLAWLGGFGLCGENEFRLKATKKYLQFWWWWLWERARVEEKVAVRPDWCLLASSPVRPLIYKGGSGVNLDVTWSTFFETILNTNNLRKHTIMPAPWQINHFRVAKSYCYNARPNARALEFRRHR